MRYDDEVAGLVLTLSEFWNTHAKSYPKQAKTHFALLLHQQLGSTALVGMLVDLTILFPHDKGSLCCSYPESVLSSMFLRRHEGRLIIPLRHDSPKA